MSAAQAVLAPDENALATLEVDLSAELRFAAGRVILTEQRLLACEPGTDTWRAWPLTAGLQLRLLEHGGVGTLDHLVAGVTEGHASAVLAASIFHFGTYTIAQAHDALRAAGLPARQPLI